MKIDDLPKASEYWARPPHRMVGDQNADSLYLAVGRALSTWESLEQLFAFLFGLFIGSESYGALRAYGSIVSASGRRDAIKEVAHVFMTEWSSSVTENDVTRFGKLLDHFGNASGRRNDIGHGMVIKLPDSYRLPGYFLVPPDYISNRNKFIVSVDTQKLDEEGLHLLLKHNYRYVSTDITLFTDGFRVLHDATEEYGTALSKKVSGGMGPFGRG